jgi:hypothetical protein
VEYLYKFIWSGGGYHSRDIRKRRIPKSWNARRMRSIFVSKKNRLYHYATFFYLNINLPNENNLHLYYIFL